MDSLITQSIAELGVSLTALAAKGTATAITAKVKALKDEKNVEAVRSAYDELVNELLEERSDAIMIAQAYKAELDRVQISDEDIASLDATVGRVLDVISKMAPGDEATRQAQMAAMQQLRELINADTLRTMQLLGFNYKAAIGMPLTEVCANKIQQLGGLSGNPKQQANAGKQRKR